jgi:hypothetical protein
MAREDLRKKLPRRFVDHHLPTNSDLSLHDSRGE